MSPNDAAMLGIGTAGFGVVIAALASNRKWEKIERVAWISLIPAVLLVVIASVFGSVNIGQDTVLLKDAGGRIIGSTTDSVWCWRCTEVNRLFSMVGKVHPITDNPKVRNLTYQIEVEIKDAALFGSPLRVANSDTIKKLRELDVDYELYEFNNTNSKALAEFYNPLDAGQRMKLEALLKGYLDERLAKRGLVLVRLEHFTVE